MKLSTLNDVKFLKDCDLMLCLFENTGSLTIITCDKTRSSVQEIFSNFSRKDSVIVSLAIE